MTLKSWTASQTATWKKQGKTFITRFVFSPMIFIVHVVWLALVLLVLLAWISPDFFRGRRRPR